MSERMKQEERMQGVAPAALWQHRKRGREALQREMTGDYDARRPGLAADCEPGTSSTVENVCPGKGASLPGKVVFSSGKLLTVHITARRAEYPAPCGRGDQHESDRKTTGVKPV